MRALSTGTQVGCETPSAAGDPTALSLRTPTRRSTTNKGWRMDAVRSDFCRGRMDVRLRRSDEITSKVSPWAPPATHTHTLPAYLGPPAAVEAGK